MSDIFGAFINPYIWGIAIFFASIAVLLEWKNSFSEGKNLYLDLNLLKSAITSSTHTLTHRGGISKYYFNLDYLSTVPEDANKIINWYVEAIEKIALKQNVEGLIFIEKDSGPVGAISLMGSIIFQTKIPGLIARLKKRNLHAKITGRPELINKLSNGLSVVIVTDAITTTRTVKDAMEAVNGFGGKVVGICTLLDRQTEHKGRVDNVPVLQGVTEEELIDSGFVKADQTDRKSVV